ncbi:hypothetical protein RB596_000706 [Gaeumannomyces avenae]
MAPPTEGKAPCKGTPNPAISVVGSAPATTAGTSMPTIDEGKALPRSQSPGAASPPMASHGGNIGDDARPPPPTDSTQQHRPVSAEASSAALASLPRPQLPVPAVTPAGGVSTTSSATTLAPGVLSNRPSATTLTPGLLSSRPSAATLAPSANAGALGGGAAMAWGWGGAAGAGGAAASGAGMPPWGPARAAGVVGGGGGAGVPGAGLGGSAAGTGAGAVAGALAAGKAESGSWGLKTDRKTAFKNYMWIFSHSTWLDRLLMAASVLASICSGVTMPIMNVVFGKVFASFTGYYHQLGPDRTQQEFRGLIIECVLYLVYLFIARFTFSYIAFLGFRMSSLRMSAAVRLEYMRAVFSMRVSMLDTLAPGQTAAVITILASTLQQGVAENVAVLLQAVSLVGSGLVVSLLYSWELTLVTGSGLVLIAAVYAATTPMLVRAMNQVQRCEIAAAAVASEVFSSARMVAACGAEAKMARRYDAFVDQGCRAGLKMSPIVACQQAPVFFAIYSTFALCFWYSLKMYMEGRITSPEVLIVVLLSVMMMTGAVGTLSTPISAAARSANAAGIFRKVHELPKPKTGGLRAPEASAAGDIALARVNFAYPARPLQRVLHDLTVRFPAGKVTAIVGPSGSGKSTVVALLQRWYEMDGNPVSNAGVLWLRNGIVQIGGRPLKDMDLFWWRAQIGLVQQEPFLFNDSIFKNVAYGLVGTEWEDSPEEDKAKRIEEACREAFAEEFIQRLPEGYNTFVGDSGIKLSGGQRQRLAIARAIIRRPKILILDEATSAIDVRGEKVVQAALERASEGRTTITIAHRLSTIQRADNIVVMRGGRAVEQGTHEQLMARGPGGVYYGLATAQRLGGEEKDGGDGDATPKRDSGADSHGKKSVADWVTSEESRQGDEETLVSSGQPQSGASRGKRGIFGSFALLLREQKRRWPWYLLLGAGAAAGGASAPIQAFLFANTVSIFQLWGNFGLLQSLANFWCLMFVVLATGVGLSYFALGWSATTLSVHIIRHYRKEYIRNMLSKRASFFDHDDNSAGALTTRLATDPAQLQQLLGMNMAFVLVSVLSVVGCLTISFYFGWKLALVTVLTMLPLILGAAFFRVRYEKRLEMMGMAVFAESAKFASEGVGAFRTVSSLTLERVICDRYAKLLRDHTRAAFFKSSGSTALFALSDSISLLCMAFILWYGGKLMAEHEYAPFQYIVVYIAVLQGGVGAGQWLSFAPNIAQASVAANRIVDLRTKDNSDGGLISLDRGDLGDNDMGVKIEFKNVWFRYPTRDVPVLSGLNMTIEKGMFAAVVGPSGSGKTTVVSLLERFYKVNAGRIAFNGIEISNLDLRSYRKDISLVAQEPCIFEGTIRENILLGMDYEENRGAGFKDEEGAEKITSKRYSARTASPAPGNAKEANSEKATDMEEALVQACKDAGIHDFISTLPEGYGTAVGNKGVALSGGQKQRLSIARALVRNPRLLLLDEATSSLDSTTERAVQAVFERTRRSRTMVVVAHRLATVQKADVIFVLGDGRVLERGDHAGLLKRRGVYYDMCQSQALDR